MQASILSIPTRTIYQQPQRTPAGNPRNQPEIIVRTPEVATEAHYEHLFAAGYAACFGGAIEFVARRYKKDVKGALVTCHTSVGPREGGGFGIAVKMEVKVPTLPKEEALAIVEEAHEEVCPYSHATRKH